MEDTELGEREAQPSTDMEFNDYRHPLKMVSSFKYLGRVLSASDNDWPTVVANIMKER